MSDPNLSNVGKLDNVRRDARRHSRNKKKEYSKAKIEEIVSSSKIKNIRYLCSGINDFKKGYRPRTNIIKDEKGDLDQTSKVFSLGGGSMSLSCSMYMVYMMLGR